MKIKSHSLLLLVFFFFSFTKSYALGTTQNALNGSFLQAQFGVSTTEDFLALKASDVSIFQQDRLLIKERIALKLVQRKIRKQLKTQKEVDVKTAWKQANSNAGLYGFLLGFLLGLVGVLIAYAIDRDIGNASWGGFAGLVLLLIVLLL